MWFGLALVALLCWSGSDFFSKIGSRPDDKYSHWKMVMAVGLVMGLHAAYEIFVNGVPISWDVIVTYLPASLLYISSMTLGYIGLRYIELSVSSPICNSSGALVALLCVIVLGETIEGLQALAVGLVCAGVIALGIVEYSEDDEARMARQEKSNIKYTKSLIAILLPVLYCLLDAAGGFADIMILDGHLNEDSANVAYELTFLFMAVCAFVYVVLIKKEKLTLHREGPKLIGGVFETAGQFAYVFAMGSDHAAVAAPMIASYCVVSCLWGRLFLKEKLSWKHYAAIALTVCGIVILCISDA